VSRATAWIESAGIPAVAIACKGFTAPARLVATAEGLPDMRLVEYPPPNIAVQNPGEIRDYAARLLDEVVAALTRPAPVRKAVAPRSSQAVQAQIVFKGDLEEVNEFFRANVWSDGLPIMPPTRAAVQAMLRFTDRSADEVIGTLRPKRLPATVWKIAVNGVMAGCRPEYMPLLIALAEAIAEPRFGIEHAGSTVGWTPLIILNGPIAKQLGFHSGQGVLRPQHQPNIAVSRFLRLLMVNVAGYRLGETDMATFGRNYYPVLAEAEDESPWPPFSTDRGYARGANVVTVQSADTISHSFLTEGGAERHLQLIATELARELGGPMLVPMEHFGGEVSPVLGLTPLVAGIIAQGGYSKSDVKRYLYEHALIPAQQFDERLDRHRLGWNLHEAVKAGTLPARFAESDDPNRRVPVLRGPEELQIVVCGAPTRNRSFIAAQFGLQGLNVSKEIGLPVRWSELVGGPGQLSTAQAHCRP
jgi:hypothetical protein